ncbi:MAG: hypothetical protein GWP05_07050 [Anaerolineaceae bacterium]|nr:hypothetical protein [Anaerolineaceae bacterium]
MTIAMHTVGPHFEFAALPPTRETIVPARESDLAAQAARTKTRKIFLLQLPFLLHRDAYRAHDDE